MSTSSEAIAEHPSFIDSAPVGDDLFEGKSQELIAESVSTLIRVDRTENRLIGFDGAWGSGKSNVIKIIAGKLRKSHHVFTYDAWGHQEDLQRRAFLEELTDDLCSNDIIDRKEWQPKLKDLLAKHQETVTKTIPRLSYGVILTALIAIFTPIAETIADGVDGRGAQILITAFPVLIGVVVYVAASIRARHLLRLSEVYAFYKEKDLTNETHVTISEREPSVKQFQGWMNDLSDALTKEQLIVVFDNMDRLPPDKVRDLWSSIHTFFAERSFGGIWVIVPFDREHIASVFGDDKSVADQFLKKSFSVIYRISPPVLTDWQSFYTLKFYEAFGTTENEELHVTRRVLDLLEPHITPRAIIAYINEMVSIRLIVEERIRLRYIGLFVLTKELILQDPVNQILSLEFLQNASSLFRDDEELPNQIAALVYNVPLASASQVTLTREIETALTDSNQRKLEALTKHPHFIDILEQVIASENVPVLNAAAGIAELDETKLRGKDVPTRITVLWDDLCAREMESPISEQKLLDTQKRLLTHASPGAAKAFVQSIVIGLRNAEQFDGANYYTALSDLREHVQAINLDADISEMSSVLRKDPNIFISYLSAAQGDYKAFKLTCDEAELTNFVIQRIPSKLKGLDVLAFVKDDFDLTAIIEHLEEQVPKNTLEADKIVPFYDLYKGIAKDQPIKSIDDGHINTLLSQVGEDEEAQLELLAMRIAKGSKFPDSGGIGRSILKEKAEDKVGLFASRIEYYTTYGDLLVEYIAWPQPVLKAILRNLTLNPYGTSKLSITTILGHFETLCASLEIAPKDFMLRLNGWKSYAKKEITSENVAKVISDSVFFENATDVDCELANHAIAEMIKHLDLLPTEEWRTALRDSDSYYFHVSYWLLNDGRLRNLPENAVVVYKELLVEVAKGQFEMPADEGWELLYDKTNKKKLKATAKNVRDLLVSEHTITPSIFLSLAGLLMGQGALSDRSADVARRILAPVIANEECRGFIVKHTREFAPIINAAGDDASDLKDAIRQQALSGDASADLVALAKAIGIEEAETTGAATGGESA